MYCSDWAKRSLSYSKLLLNNMKINRANNINIRFTPIQIVNLELYASVSRLLVNIVLYKYVKIYLRTIIFSNISNCLNMY